MRRLTADNIRDIAIKSGFKLKEQPNGEMDLNPYVFDFAQSLTAELEKRLAEVEQWVAAIADDHEQIPDWIQQSARSLLASGPGMSNECLKMSNALKIANKRIDELERYNLGLANESHNKTMAIERFKKRLAEVERERDEASKSLEYVKERSNKMGDNIKSNNESLCKLIDALSQSNIIIKEFKAALNRIHAECVDVLFDFAARRDSRGLILPIHYQAPEVKEAISVFEQLRQQLNGGE